MNPKHQTFLLEYYRTGNKTAAYRKAYPDIKDTALNSSVNRLMARADIAEAIQQHQTRVKEQVETEIAERYKAALISHYEALALLSNIIKGQHTRPKYVKDKDGQWITIDVSPTTSEVLRALNIYLRVTRQEQQTATTAPNKAATNTPPPKEKQTQSPRRSPEEFREAEVLLPPEPEKTAPHPYGNIYPANYPGPYYDPNDPNTKDKLQNLKLTDAPVTTNTASTNNNQGRHSERREEPPEPMQSAQSGPPLSTTNNNNAQQTTIAPVIAGESKAIPPPQKQTTPGNKPQQKTDSLKEYYRQKFEKQKQWKAKLEQMRKEGWETADELLNEVHDVYINNQHSGTYKMFKQFEKAVQSRHLPPEEREKVTQETGWEYHPEHPHVMRRRRRN